MTSLKEGELFARKYKLIKHHDTGGFASIWKALQLVNQEIVALKVFPTLNATARNQIIQEMEKASHLRHEHLIVPVDIDVSDEGQLALKMPFCGGGNASDLVGKMTERQAALFLKQVAWALAYLHEKNYNHGDVKPNNVLLGPILHKEQMGGEFFPGPNHAEEFYLCDLSLSQNTQQTIRRTLNMNSDEVGNDIKKESGMGKTPTCYRAPELYPQYQPVKASDIWALGASLFEILSDGTLPFGDLGGLTQTDDPSGIPSLPLGVKASPDLDLIIRSCLLKNTWDRPIAEKLFQYGKAFLETGQWLNPEEKEKLTAKLAKPKIKSSIGTTNPETNPGGATVVGGNGPDRGSEGPITIARPRWLKVVLLTLLLSGLGVGGYVVFNHIRPTVNNSVQPPPVEPIPSDGDKQVAQLLQEAKASLEGGRCDEATTKYNEVLRLKPGYGPAEDGLLKVKGATQSGMCGSRVDSSVPKEESKAVRPKPPGPVGVVRVSTSPCDTGEPAGGRITQVESTPNRNETIVTFIIISENGGKVSLFPAGHRNAFRMVFGSESASLSRIIGPTGESLEVPAAGLKVQFIFDKALPEGTARIKLIERGTGSGNWCNQATLTWAR
jgi:serine/threonine protein kinase